MNSNIEPSDHNVAAAQALLKNDRLPFHRKITYVFSDMS